MLKPPWWWWLQIRDLVPVIVSILVLTAFLVGAVWVVGHEAVHVSDHIRAAWNHP